MILGVPAGPMACAMNRECEVMNEEHVEKILPTATGKRPTGLTIIAIAWLFGGILNLYTSSQIISSDLETLQFLSLPDMPEWYKLGVPAEIAIALLISALGLAQMYTIYGAWTGKAWSYRLALAIPILTAIASSSHAALYVSAPIELGLRRSVNWGVVSSNMVWLVIYWGYLREPHVREYLGQEKARAKQGISKKLLLAIVILIPVAVLTTGFWLGTQHSPLSGYETYSKYGFSFKHLKSMTIEEFGLLEDTATNNSGQVSVQLKNEKYELFHVSWVKTEMSLNLETTLEDAFEIMKHHERVTNFTEGELVETTQTGHRMLYQYYNITFESEVEYHGIYGVWYCDASQTNYHAHLMTTEEEIFPIFNTYLDSFVCHEQQGAS